MTCLLFIVYLEILSFIILVTASGILHYVSVSCSCSGYGQCRPAAFQVIYLLFVVLMLISGILNALQFSHMISSTIF